MTQIEEMYFNNREALIDEICELEKEIQANLKPDADPSKFYPRFAELEQNLSWANPCVFGRDQISLNLSPMSKEASDLLEEEENATKE